MQYAIMRDTKQAAIAQMTKVLALQLIGKGIRVNAVAPGPMLTPMNPATMPDENIEKLGKSTILQQLCCCVIDVTLLVVQC
jgi:NAD(P)-dependent dehydrogenase (short-subunit alcohol dehydrogenase family)